MFYNLGQIADISYLEN